MNDSEVYLTAIAALGVRMLVCFYVRKEFHHLLCLSVTSIYVQIGSSVCYVSIH